jgi:hypothetical protein
VSQSTAAATATSRRRDFRPSRTTARVASVGVGLLSAATLVALGAPAAFAAQPTVGLGTATSYAILAGSAITNTGPSVISGDIGISPNTGSSITGFPPGIQNNGTRHDGDGAANQAKGDLRIAYIDARSRNPVIDVTAPLGAGQSLTAGIYNAPSSMQLNGELTLTGGPDDVFVFQAGSTLKTASSASVVLAGQVSACNVFWQVGSSATLGTDTDFAGTIMANQSISVNDSVNVRGRLLARAGAVTLINDTITRPNCATVKAVVHSEPGGGTATGGTGGNGGGSGGNGGGSGGNGSGSGGSGSGSGGSGSPGTGLGNGTTTVPEGHPETGRMPAQGDDRGTDLLLLSGGLALGGAVLASSRAVRRRPRRIAQ